jgi:Phosphotransferase enzyme family
MNAIADMNVAADDVGRLYRACEGSEGTHLALPWQGRTRFTVPVNSDPQYACWRVFRPGTLGIPLRAMAQLPRLFNIKRCREGPEIGTIREAVGCASEPSCCRAGAAGPWCKDALLLLDAKTAEPRYFVKAGSGEAVNALLANEANWLHKLRGEMGLASQVPELVAHRSGEDLCFVAQRPLAGDLDFGLAEPQMDFLRKLQRSSLKTMRYEDSRLAKTLASRLADLGGRLTDAWAKRLQTCTAKIAESMLGQPIDLVAAHGDFNPWNTRLDRGVARVFDWEYADDEQFPLFDPLHFALMPMALKSRPMAKIIWEMQRTICLCRQGLGEERCYQSEIQALAYLTNLCTLYIWADRGEHNLHPTLMSYAQVIDHLLAG